MLSLRDCRFYVFWRNHALDRQVRRNPLEETHSEVLNLSILVSTSLPKQQLLAINIPKTTQRLLLLIKSLSPHHPLPSYFLERIHNLSSPAVILKYLYHGDWMAEPFPEKSLLFTYFTRWNFKESPFSFCQFRSADATTGNSPVDSEVQRCKEWM